MPRAFAALTLYASSMFFDVLLLFLVCLNDVDQSVTNIFKYSIIQIYWSQVFIRTFVRINFSFMNIFEHSFVLNLLEQIYSDIRSLVC